MLQSDQDFLLEKKKKTKRRSPTRKAAKWRWIEDNPLHILTYVAARGGGSVKVKSRCLLTRERRSQQAKLYKNSDRIIDAIVIVNLGKVVTEVLKFAFGQINKII